MRISGFTLTLYNVLNEFYHYTIVVAVFNGVLVCL